MTTKPNDAVRMLLRRAQSQLLKWAEKYGENNPSWLPPAGDVRLMEDMAEFIDTANVQAEEVPAHPAQGDVELSDEMILDLARSHQVVASRSRIIGFVRDVLQSPARVDSQSLLDRFIQHAKQNYNPIMAACIHNDIAALKDSK